jgi:hypothetical protein
MRLSSLAIVALIVGASSPAYVSIALAAPECSRSMELPDWGENSTGDINVTSGESCTFPITLRGEQLWNLAEASTRQGEED